MAFPARSTMDALNFGQHYAILNLDWMSILVNAINETGSGQALIANCSRWNDAIHRKSPRPLTIFTTLFFNRAQPELESNKPFSRLMSPFGTFEEGFTRGSD
ncbi:hypothetical protein V1506DRAFT_99344 [Lipomyces tetrasporus]